MKTGNGVQLSESSDEEYRVSDSDCNGIICAGIYFSLKFFVFFFFFWVEIEMLWIN